MNRNVYTPTPAWVFFLLPFATGWWAWSETAEVRDAMRGAYETEGVVTELVEHWHTGTTGKSRKRPRRYLGSFEVHVTFTGPNGEELSRPAQYDGPGPKDIYFDAEIETVGSFREGTRFDLYYHPDKDIVWLNDFFTLWIFPLFMWGITAASALVAAFFVVAFVLATNDEPKKR